MTTRGGTAAMTGPKAVAKAENLALRSARFNDDRQTLRTWPQMLALRVAARLAYGELNAARRLRVGLFASSFLLSATVPSITVQTIRLAPQAPTMMGAQTPTGSRVTTMRRFRQGDGITSP